MMRSCNLLILTLALFSFTCFAQKSGIIPVCKIEGQWHLLLQNREHTLFWTDFSADIAAGDEEHTSRARQALEDAAGFFAFKKDLTEPLRIGENRDYLYLASVDHTMPRDRQRWIPIETILSNGSIDGFPIEEDLQRALSTSWRTEVSKLEGAAPRVHEERERVSAAGTSRAPVSTPEKKPAFLTEDETLIRPDRIPTPFMEDEADEHEIAPEPKQSGRMSIPDYLAMHAATKHISYATAPAAVHSTNKKRCTTHHKKRNKQHIRRRAAALMFHRKHRTKKLCRKTCKALVRKRRQCIRAAIHKRRSLKK